MLNLMPDYFLDNPAFEIVFSTDWQEGFNIFRIYIIKIDRTLLLDSDYPITITTDVWPTLIENTKNILGETYDFRELVNLLGSRPIVFKPESSENFNNYMQIAEAFISLGKIDLASYEYHSALNNSPDQVNRLEIIATKLISEYPDEAGPWLLIGDINRINEDYMSAITAYNYALSKPRSSKFIDSAIHFGLGRVYSLLGESKQAIDNFIDGININYFGRNEAQITILQNKGAFYLSIGEFDRALDFFYQAYPSIDIINQESSDFRTVVDLISQFDKAHITSSQENNVHPTVFIINDQPRRALYAHPSSSVKYHIQLPKNSFLSFTPMLAPYVWKIGKGDGVQFDVILTNEMGEHYKLYSRYIDPKNIFEHRNIEEQMVKLSPWGGQSVELEFITSPGPNDNFEFDWAAWGDLRLTQKIFFNFLDNFPNSDLENYIPNSIQPGTLEIDGDVRSIKFQHPPSRVKYKLLLPNNPSLYFGIGMDPSVWSFEKGDGMTFTIFIQKTSELDTLYQIFQKYIDPKNFRADRKWFDYKLNLDEFGGHEVNIIFDTHPGPLDNSNFDWGGWSMPVLVAGE
jgi:tetratricopeptide (TPR) repeat protein